MFIVCLLSEIRARTATLQTVSIDPGTHLPKCDVIYLHQMIGPLLHDQFEVIGIVDGELWAHQHVLMLSSFQAWASSNQG